MALPERRRPARPLGKVKGTGQAATRRSDDDVDDSSDQSESKSKGKHSKRRKS